MAAPRAEKNDERIKWPKIDSPLPIKLARRRDFLSSAKALCSNFCNFGESTFGLWQTKILRMRISKSSKNYSVRIQSSRFKLIIWNMKSTSSIQKLSEKKFFYFFSSNKSSSLDPKPKHNSYGWLFDDFKSQKRVFTAQK